MSRKSRDFPDDSDGMPSEVNMSDSDLEALMSGHSPAHGAESPALQSLEPGSQTTGVVIDFRGGEILVELDSKHHGVIDEKEFDEGELPDVGAKIKARFERYDKQRDIAVLSVRETRQEVLWDELRVGLLVEGLVAEVNKGGLTIDIKGIRAFLPISQIERERIEDPSVYVGKRLLCEVTSFDRADENLVLSRKTILERQAEEHRGKALARLSEGEVLKGTVVKVTSHGAFVNLGGVEGLLHMSRIREYSRELSGQSSLEPGQQLEVVIARIDRQRNRIALDFQRVAAHTWATTVEDYKVGAEVTGWVTRVTTEGAFVSFDEGVEGILPRAELLDLDNPLNRGTILRVVIARIDSEKERLELKPISTGTSE